MKNKHIVNITFLLLLFAFAGLRPCYAQYTPGGFFSLARSGDLEGIKAELAKNPSPSLKNGALEAAVIGGQVEVIKLLVESGANVNFTSPNGTVLLVKAIMLEQYAAAQALIELDADPHLAGYNRLYHDYPVSWQWNALMAASYQGQIDLARKLLEKGADLSQTGWSVSKDEPETAADIAAYSGHLDILEYLIEEGASVDFDTIHKAACGGHLKVVKFLIKNGIDVNKPLPNGKTLLMEAAWWGHLDLVEYLISADADINASDENGYTAVSEAAANGGDEFPNQLEIVKTLVKNGADIRQAAPYKETPLMRAKDPQVIEYLVESGAK